MMNESADKAKLLLHATGKLSSHAGSELAHACSLKQLRGTLVPLNLAYTKEIGIEADVFVDGEVLIEPKPLRHVLSACFAPSGSRTTSRPATVALPESGGRMPASMRIVVVLPAPSGPTRPKISPGTRQSSVHRQRARRENSW